MADIYQRITQQIIEQLENGQIPWQKPWRGSVPKNLVSGKEYRGVNLLILGMAPYSSPHWLTYRQCQKLGGNVRRGQRGTPVVFWTMVPVEGSSSKPKMVPIIRYYTVFNTDQCEGLEVPEEQTLDFAPISECERVVAGMPIPPEIREEGNMACYIPNKDRVLMPPRNRFEGEEEYYSTLFHELIHSTGHSSRLNRKGIANISAFGSESYSKEELVAELGSSFLSGFTGIENKTIENQGAYIRGWLEKLKNDKRLVVQAAGAAQRAVDFIRGVSPEKEEQE